MLIYIVSNFLFFLVIHRYHLSAFHNVATSHYLKGSEMFYTNLVKAPALFLVGKNDPIGTESSNLRVRDAWKQMGIQVISFTSLLYILLHVPKCFRHISNVGTNLHTSGTITHIQKSIWWRWQNFWNLLILNKLINKHQNSWKRNFNRNLKFYLLIIYPKILF